MRMRMRMMMMMMMINIEDSFEHVLVLAMPMIHWQ